MAFDGSDFSLAKGFTDFSATSWQDDRGVIAAIGTEIYFVAADSGAGIWSWDTAGSADPAKLSLTGLTLIRDLVAVGDKLYFAADSDIDYKRELWEWDPGTNSQSQVSSSAVLDLTELDGDLYFVTVGDGGPGDNPIAKYDLSTSTETTSAVANIAWDLEGHNGKIYYGSESAIDSSMYAAWEYDPSSGTHTEIPGTIADEVDSFTSIGDSLYYLTKNLPGNYDLYTIDFA